MLELLAPLLIHPSCRLWRLGKQSLLPPPIHGCVLTAHMCVKLSCSQVSRKLLVPGQHLHPPLKCDFGVRQTWFLLLQSPRSTSRERS